MKVRVADIPDEGLIVDVREKPGGDDAPLTSPIEAHLELRKSGQSVHVHGRLGGDIEVACSRCLKPVKRTLELPLDVTFHPMPEMGPDKHELQMDEMDLDFYEGDSIDLGGLLREQVLLNMDIKPLCDENCRGICQQCGKDLSTGDCLCKKEATDSRLEVLRKFMDKGKE